MQELGSSISSSFELIPTNASSTAKEGRSASLVSNLVLDKIGSRYIVPTVLLYVSSNGEKNENDT